jgi:translation initiation factor IF-2
MPDSIQTKEIKAIVRPPVVVVMGHIDHGKTTLLDFIRKANVAAGESGSITQHIGAYEIEFEGRRITFLDTPGHESFSKMRSRGARVADVAVLVVAADDGVKPQTLEALKAITEAGIPYIVAINKIDKPEANSDRVKQELAEKGVLLEGWGGSVPVALTSGKEGKGVPELLELLFLVTDLENLTADSAVPAKGVVIETQLDTRRGNTATLLIKDGTLKKGDWIVSGITMASVKILEDFQGKTIQQATFSSPVRVLGFAELPVVGEAFIAFPDRKQAEGEVAEHKRGGAISTLGTGELLIEKQDGKFILPIIVKADVAGTREAIETELAKLEFPEIGLKILRSGVGDITDEDIKLASSQKGAVVIGFKVKAPASTVALAERFGETVKTFQIIYEIVDWLRMEMEQRIPPEVKRTDQGKLRILKVFKQLKDRQVFGGKVLSGVVLKGAKFDLIRRAEKVGAGKIVNLQQNKDDVTEVRTGFECGISADLGAVPEEGDIIEVYIEEVTKKSLSTSS